MNKIAIMILAIAILITGCRTSDYNTGTAQDLQTDVVEKLSESDTQAEYKIFQPDGNQYYVKIERGIYPQLDIVELRNHSEQIIQTFFVKLGAFDDDIDFQDVNLDGYIDLQISAGGTMNKDWVFYVWDNNTKQFNAVEFDREQIEMISWFSVSDGYVLNQIKSGAGSGYIQKLVWNENTLVKESEEKYEIEE